MGSPRSLSFLVILGSLALSGAVRPSSVSERAVEPAARRANAEANASVGLQVGATGLFKRYSHETASSLAEVDTNKDTDALSKERLQRKRAAAFPAGMLNCSSGKAALKTKCGKGLGKMAQTIRKRVAEHHDLLCKDCNSEGCPRGDFAGCLVRLVGHDFMDYNADRSGTGQGGADGCINFEDPDNKGLKGCLLEAVAEDDTSLEGIWQEFCTEVSLADFFVIVAEALIVNTLPKESESWGPELENQFRFGRTTRETCDNDLLPNPEHSCKAVEDNFVTKLGLDWKQATALMGVHTLGRAEAKNSGFNGYWVAGDHAKSFNNHYFKTIVAAAWKPGLVQASGKWQWIRADGGPKDEMMLNTDICLGWNTNAGGRDPEGTFLNAASPAYFNAGGPGKPCCLWQDAGKLGGVDCECQIGGKGQCSFSRCCDSDVKRGCPQNNPFTVQAKDNGSPAAVQLFAKDADAWLKVFQVAWKKVTENGHTDLCPASDHEVSEDEEEGNDDEPDDGGDKDDEKTDEEEKGEEEETDNEQPESEAEPEDVTEEEKIVSFSLESSRTAGLCVVADARGYLKYHNCGPDKLSLRKIDAGDGNFILKDLNTGMCVNPQGEKDSPDQGTRLILSANCVLARKASHFSELDQGNERFVLKHSAGKCVHPHMGWPWLDRQILLWDGCAVGTDRLTFRNWPEVTAQAVFTLESSQTPGLCAAGKPHSPWARHHPGASYIEFKSCESDKVISFTKVPVEGGSRFMLRDTVTGMCVHPKGGRDKPTKNTRLVMWWSCTESRKALQFTEKDTGNEQFMLQHSGGYCVHPLGGKPPLLDKELIFYNKCNAPDRLIFRKPAKVLAPPPAPPQEGLLGYAKGNSCPGTLDTASKCCSKGFEQISSIDECKKAFEALKSTSLAKTIWRGDYPRERRMQGCFLWAAGKLVFFNPTKTVGQVMPAGDEVICKKS